MGIGSIKGSYQGTPWEVKLKMDFGNSIWEKRQVKGLYGQKSFFPEERRVVKTLNKLDHKLSQTARAIIWFDEEFSNLGEIRKCFAKVYERADKLSEYSGGNLDASRLFRKRLLLMLKKGELGDMDDILKGLERVWSEIQARGGVSGQNSNSSNFS